MADNPDSNMARQFMAQRAQPTPAGPLVVFGLIGAMCLGFFF